jgi:hypothetical protein
VSDTQLAKIATRVFVGHLTIAPNHPATMLIRWLFLQFQVYLF